MFSWANYLDISRFSLVSLGPEHEGPIPYDPAGFLDQVKAKAPKISKLSLEYVEEAILCFRGGAYRATAVMLGVASEEIFLNLIRAFEKKVVLILKSITQANLTMFSDSIIDLKR